MKVKWINVYEVFRIVFGYSKYLIYIISCFYKLVLSVILDMGEFKVGKKLLGYWGL